MPKPQAGATEVVAKPENDRRQRRRLSAAEKERIFAEADRCERGQLGEFLRSEGIYSSLLNHWRLQRKQRGAEGLENRKPGPASTKDARDSLIEAQNRRTAALEREVRIQNALLKIQAKAHEILGGALPRIDDSEMSALQKSSVERARKSR